MIRAENLCKIFRRTVNANDINIDNSDLDNENERNKKIKENKKAKKQKQKTEDFYAVDHVNISATNGEILGILGPNGAGKTTLLRMLAQLMEPTSGTISILNKDGTVLNNQVEIKNKIGYLSGNTRLYHRFTIRELLLILSDIYGISKDEANRRIEEISTILKLDNFIDNKIERLSTGQTQRANIARCLIHKPEIYIFDEPTLGLDIISSEAIVEFMKSEKEKGKVILYSTHYMEEAQYLCDKIAFMHKGNIITAGTPEQLMENTETNNLRDAFKKLAF